MPIAGQEDAMTDIRRTATTGPGRHESRDVLMATTTTRRVATTPTEDNPIASRPVPPAGQADPAPIGLAAIGGSAFILSVVNADQIDRTALPVLFGVALAYGGVVLLLAGMWELKIGNTFGATAFLTYGGFFLSFWALEQFYLRQIVTAPGGAQHVGPAIGLFVLPWAIFTTCLGVASLRTTAALASTFALAVPTLWLLTAGYFGLHLEQHQLTNDTIRTAGWFGIVTAAAAWYASAAGVVNTTFGRKVLPNKSLRRA
jgi:succinate-acetate transporter protein